MKIGIPREIKPNISSIASVGLKKAVKCDSSFYRGVNNIYKGQITCRAVAKAQQREFTPLKDIL